FSTFYPFCSPHCLHSFLVSSVLYSVALFFFNATATTEIYTLSLHDALPICRRAGGGAEHAADRPVGRGDQLGAELQHAVLLLVGDRKSTRLNSSHVKISYAVFCLKKKNKQYITKRQSQIDIRQSTFLYYIRQ